MSRVANLFMNDPTLQEIKDRLNIADVISGYIPIKKAGVMYISIKRSFALRAQDDSRLFYE